METPTRSPLYAVAVETRCLRPQVFTTSARNPLNVASRIIAPEDRDPMAITRTPLAAHDGDAEGDAHPHEPLPAQHPSHPPSHPPHSLHHHSLPDASTVTVDIEAWTVAALESLSIAPIARGTGNALSIPLDADHGAARDSPSNGPATEMKLRGVNFGDDAYGANIAPPRRPPSRRDSMRKRDMLLKGKEGSRQRRRWENGQPAPSPFMICQGSQSDTPPPDRLIHVPNVQPPLPSDWQIHPTHRVLPTVPYQLAQYWDKGLRERAEAQHRQRKNAAGGSATSSFGDTEAGHVPRDLRATAKRTPAVKSFLRVLEEPVRQFVVERGLAVPTGGGKEGGESSSDETDPDDEEIVFVGRNGRMRDGKPWKRAERQVAGQGQEVGMVLDAMEEGDGGAFKCVFFLPLLFCSLCSSVPLSYPFTPPSHSSSLPPIKATPTYNPAQALAHPLHFGLLRPRLQIRHDRQPRPPRRLRRREAKAGRPAPQAAQSAGAAPAVVGDVLSGVCVCVLWCGIGEVCRKHTLVGKGG